MFPGSTRSRSAHGAVSAVCRKSPRICVVRPPEVDCGCVSYVRFAMVLDASDLVLPVYYISNLVKDKALVFTQTLVLFGSPGQTRTANLIIHSQYQLVYKW